MPIQDIIFTPDILSVQHVAHAKKILAEPGIRYGIHSVDERMVPLRGGKVSVTIGRPGDGKTTMLSYLAIHECNEIIRLGLEAEETVLFCTWENTVDEIYAAIIASMGEYTATDLSWGRVPIETVERTASLRGVIPITFIGFSSFRKSGYKHITLDMILDAADAIQAGTGVAKRKIRLLIADYLQLISVPGKDKVERVGEAVVELKNLAIRLDIPVHASGQAGRQVDSYNVKLAGPADCQWASAIEQHIDVGNSIWRVIRTENYDPNTPNTINMYGTHIPISPYLFIMRNWKQRGADIGGWWPLFFRPEICHLAEMELDVDELEV